MSNFEHRVRAARLGRDAALMAIGAVACWFTLVVITA